MEKHFTLYELNRLVGEAVEAEMDNAYWLEAELAEVRESRGHCYMELVEYRKSAAHEVRGTRCEVRGARYEGRGEQRGSLLARASARCWSSTWMLLRPHFERIAGEPLRAGMTVLLQVYPQFHEAYGFSWIVTDINPEFTVGDMVRQRQEIIRQLKAEGVFDLQKELQLPMFAQRIAVVSSATAAGYGDFCNQLAENAAGLQFHTELFAATMQGEQVEPSVIAALNRINQRADDFDVVVIIRGGGATTDLSGFDTLLLAENVANFPLPILTGIGHDRDESILDMVAHTRVKTPTAAAAFLIEHLMKVYRRITEAEVAIGDHISHALQVQQLRLERLSQLIPRLPERRMVQAKYRLDGMEQRLTAAVRRRLETADHRLATIAVQLRAYDPALLLERGYSITTHRGHVVRDPLSLRPGDEIETRVEKGSFKSIIK